MKTELEIANERILELENQVKNISLNLPVIKSLPSVEEIEKKWFYPTDKIKDEAARVGARWMRHRILGELPH